jgi:hypothetical protein
VTSGVLAEKPPVEASRLVLRFEPESLVEFLGEPLVTLDDRLPEAEDRLGVHRELVGGLVVGIERERLLRGGERTGGVAVVEAEVAELFE